MEDLIEGRIVHYVMPNGEHRPAIVVKVWDQSGILGTSNLQVITDGPNDLPYSKEKKEKFTLDAEAVKHGHIWATSVRYSLIPEPHTWHWPEKKVIYNFQADDLTGETPKIT